MGQCSLAHTHKSVLIGPYPLDHAYCSMPVYLYPRLLTGDHKTLPNASIRFAKSTLPHARYPTIGNKYFSACT